MRVKFCGITRYDDAEHAARVGAWAVGINHWKGSSRYCEPDVAAEIGAGLRRETTIVGVFVNQKMGEISRAVENHHLSMVQLHGDEGLSFCNEVSRRTGCPVIKAIRVRVAADVIAARAFRTDFHLLDAYSDEARGGTGETFDWSILRKRHTKARMILAGGLTPYNVAEAIEEARPWAVDVASGIEKAPGIKDHNVMSDFITRANEAGGETELPALHEPEHFVESMEKNLEERRLQAEEAAAARREAEEELA